MRVVHHEPLDDVFPEVYSFVIRGRDDHAVLGIDHAAHLNPLYRTFHEFHRTHPAGADRPQAVMIAEPGDDDLRGGRLNHFYPWDLCLCHQSSAWHNLQFSGSNAIEFKEWNNCLVFITSLFQKSQNCPQ
jgi:hypothetical protein